MPITQPGGTIVYRTFAADTQALLIAGARQALLDAGWTTASTVNATVSITFTGQPSNGQTVVLDGQTFTAVNTLVNPNDFLIGATFGNTATNLAAIIAANSTNFTAFFSLGTVVINARVAGPAFNGKGLTDGLSNTSASGTITSGGGYKLKCALDPTGNQMVTYLSYSGATLVQFNPQSVDGTIDFGETTQALEISTGRTYTTICNQFCGCFLLSGSTAPHTSVMFGLVRVYDAVSPIGVSAITNNGGLFEITTVSPHGLQSLESVFITNTVVADGFWASVTVIDPTHFTLDGSTFAGGWTSGGNISGPTQVGRVFWAAAGGFNGGAGGWRKTPDHWLSVPAFEHQYYCVNTIPIINNNNSAGEAFPGLRMVNTRDLTDSDIPEKFGGRWDGLGAEVGWPLNSQNSDVFFYGYLYGLMIYQAGLDRDTLQTLFGDGHNWYVIGSDGTYSLCMAVN